MIDWVNWVSDGLGTAVTVGRWLEDNSIEEKLSLVYDSDKEMGTLEDSVIKSEDSTVETVVWDDKGTLVVFQKCADEEKRVEWLIVDTEIAWLDE